MPTLTVPAYVRGTLVSSDLVSFSGRGGETRFRAPEPSSFAQLPAVGDAGPGVDVAEVALHRLAADVQLGGDST